MPIYQGVTEETIREERRANFDAPCCALHNLRLDQTTVSCSRSTADTEDNCKRAGVHEVLDLHHPGALQCSRY